MEYSSLLTNLRIISTLKRGDYLACKFNGNIAYKYSNVLYYSFRLDVWGYTHSTLKKIFCEDLPNYIEFLGLANQFQLKDLLSVLSAAIEGLKNLKLTWLIYDEKFDTLIQSYAEIHKKRIENILIPEMPELKRQNAYIEPECKMDLSS